MASRRQTEEELKKKLAKKAARFKALFTSPDGAQVLEDLKQEFLNKRLVGDDSHKTTVLAAQADVIVYIEEVINYSYKGESDEFEPD